MKTESPQSQWVPQQYSNTENSENLNLKDEEDGNRVMSADKDMTECSDDSSMSEEEPKEDFKTLMDRRHEKWESIVKDFLEQVRENRFSEFSWPPDPDCPLCKYGLLDYFVGEEEESDETTKKFIDQVQKSWGYDVDRGPPDWRIYSFYRLDFGNKDVVLLYGERVKMGAQIAIDRINSQAKKMMGEGKTFELVEVNKAVVVNRALFLLTLTIKDVEANTEKFIRATVSEPTGHPPELEECKLIPSVPT